MKELLFKYFAMAMYSYPDNSFDDLSVDEIEDAIKNTYRALEKGATWL